MRPINVSLDSVTWELAKRKQNFSAWVRDQLRSEDNKRKAHKQRARQRCRNSIKMARPGYGYYQECHNQLGYVAEEE